MKLHYRLPLLASLAVAAVLALSTGMAHAAPQEITMTPTSASPVIAPGGTGKGSFQILNQGGTAYDFQTYAAPYHVNGEEYTPEFTALPNTTPVDKWFTLTAKSGHVNAGQSATVSYSINVPKNTVPGGYYAVVFAQTQYPKAANSITLNQRVGEIFYIQVSGPVTQKGKVLSWSAPFLQEPPLTAALRLENSGSVHYPATIHVNVRDVFGHSKYGLYTVKEVLPQTIRKVPINWSKAPALGIFKVTGTVKILGQTTTLPTQWVLVMSQGVRVGLFAIIALIALFVAVQFFYRWRKAKKEQEQEPPTEAPVEKISKE